MSDTKFAAFLTQFETKYSIDEKRKIWTNLSSQFRNFWDGRVMVSDDQLISDDDCDEVIRILDRSGKGNTQNSEAIARAMVPQGAWRRLFNILHANKKLGGLVNRILIEEDLDKKAELIDQLYSLPEAQKMYLIGPSGNTVSALLAGYDPFNNLSVISLNDRRKLIEYFNLSYISEFDSSSIGKKIIKSNLIIAEALRENGITGDARRISEYCYLEPVTELWKEEFSVKDQSEGKPAEYTVTISSEKEHSLNVSEDEVRHSIKVQGALARIGELMGFQVWLPRPDRALVAKVWQPKSEGVLLDELPLSYDSKTLSTIRLIDVIWFKNRRSIARAFEVEHTTSIYSGILRMADLVALQPDIKIKMHIVAPFERQDKFLTEIRRPVFTYMTNARLSEMCTFISYDNIELIADLPHLHRTNDGILEDYEVSAESQD